MKKYHEIQEVLPLFEETKIMDDLKARSDAQLLSIFLDHQGKSGEASACGIINRAGGLRSVLNHPERYLAASECERIFALKEVFRRYLKEELKRSDAITSPDLVKEHLQARLRDLDYEVFGMLLLDNQNRVIDSVELFRGTIDGSAVYPREVVKVVLKHEAAAVIIYHNHPSGIAEPSRSDRAITETLKKALQVIDVRLLDHLIAGDGCFESFAERGWL